MSFVAKNRRDLLLPIMSKLDWHAIGLKTVNAFALWQYRRNRPFCFPPQCGFERLLLSCAALRVFVHRTFSQKCHRTLAIP